MTLKSVIYLQTHHYVLYSIQPNSAHTITIESRLLFVWFISPVICALIIEQGPNQGQLTGWRGTGGAAHQTRTCRVFLWERLFCRAHHEADEERWLFERKEKKSQRLGKSERERELTNGLLIALWINPPLNTKLCTVSLSLPCLYEQLFLLNWKEE